MDIQGLTSTSARYPDEVDTEIGYKVADTKADKEVIIATCLKEVLVEENVENIDEKIQDMQDSYEEFKNES